MCFFRTAGSVDVTDLCDKLGRELSLLGVLYSTRDLAEAPLFGGMKYGDCVDLAEPTLSSYYFGEAAC